MGKFKIGKIYDPALKDMSVKEIKDNLEAVCYQSEERSYTKNLTEEELIERKDEYSKIGIRLRELNEEKKKIVDRYKTLLKEPTDRAKILVESIQFKSEQTYGELFHIDDQEEGLMYIFDVTGMCIEARPLKKEEKQLKLKTINE